MENRLQNNKEHEIQTGVILWFIVKVFGLGIGVKDVLRQKSVPFENSLRKSQDAA